MTNHVMSAVTGRETSATRISGGHPAMKPPYSVVNAIDVDKGEFAFLIGPSGSGKSTFLRLLLREDSPTKGQLEVAGKDLVKMRKSKVPAHRRRLGCVFQDFRLLQNKTVEQNVGFALEVLGRPRAVIRRVVPEVLELVGLEGKSSRLPHELSGGEQSPGRSSTARCCCWPTSPPATSTRTPVPTSCCCWNGSIAPAPQF